jgi:hypothetical protein
MKTHFSPSALASASNSTENASQSAQKYFFAVWMLRPMYERRQKGRIRLQGARKRGCQRPMSKRGASTVSHSDCAEMIACMSWKRCSGSFWIFTSTLNLTWRFSGYEDTVGEHNADIIGKTDEHASGAQQSLQTLGSLAWVPWWYEGAAFRYRRTTSGS